MPDQLEVEGCEFMAHLSSQGLRGVPRAAVPQCSSPCPKPVTPCCGSGRNITNINELILYIDESLKDPPAEEVSV